MTCRGTRPSTDSRRGTTRSTPLAERGTTSKRRRCFLPRSMPGSRRACPGGFGTSWMLRAGRDCISPRFGPPIVTSPATASTQTTRCWRSLTPEIRTRRWPRPTCAVRSKQPAHHGRPSISSRASSRRSPTSRTRMTSRSRSAPWRRPLAPGGVLIVEPGLDPNTMTPPQRQVDRLPVPGQDGATQTLTRVTTAERQGSKLVIRFDFEVESHERDRASSRERWHEVHEILLAPRQFYVDAFARAGLRLQATSSDGSSRFIVGTSVGGSSVGGLS